MGGLSGLGNILGCWRRRLYVQRWYVRLVVLCHGLVLPAVVGTLTLEGHSSSLSPPSYNRHNLRNGFYTHRSAIGICQGVQ
jgi:hypothetical protein